MDPFRRREDATRDLEGFEIGKREEEVKYVCVNMWWEDTIQLSVLSLG